MESVGIQFPDEIEFQCGAGVATRNRMPTWGKIRIHRISDLAFEQAFKMPWPGSSRRNNNGPWRSFFL